MVQGSQDSDTRQHDDAATISGVDQHLHRELPVFLRGCLRWRSQDVFGGVLERDELATAGQGGSGRQTGVASRCPVSLAPASRFYGRQPGQLWETAYLRRAIPWECALAVVLGLPSPATFLKRALVPICSYRLAGTGLF
jgi:hypothetical protein